MTPAINVSKMDYLSWITKLFVEFWCTHVACNASGVMNIWIRSRSRPLSPSSMLCHSVQSWLQLCILAMHWEPFTTSFPKSLNPYLKNTLCFYHHCSKMFPKTQILQRKYFSLRVLRAKIGTCSFKSALPFIRPSTYSFQHRALFLTQCMLAHNAIQFPHWFSNNLFSRHSHQSFLWPTRLYHSLICLGQFVVVN